MGYKGQKARDYAREWMRKRRAAYFIGKQCEWCGSSENLQIHHLDPKIKRSHAIWSWSQARRDTELAKCIVLCKSCHIKYHNHQKTLPLVHGTLNAYWHKKCRCKECGAAASRYAKEYNRRKREQCKAAS